MEDPTDEPRPLVVNLLPILYDTLPEPERFLKFCREVAQRVDEDPVLKHYDVSARVAEEFLGFVPKLAKGVVPPPNRAYNAMDGWLTTDHGLRFRLEMLLNRDPDGSTEFPGLGKNNIILALIPASVDASEEVAAKERHFNMGAAWAGSYLVKAAVLVYHRRTRDAAGAIVEEEFREIKPGEIAGQIVENIAEYHLGIEDPQMEFIRIEFGYETHADPEWADVQDRLRVLYFGSSFCAFDTLKRALLLFDDLHFHDRPSLVVGKWGLIGGPSPARRYAYTFAKEGVPLLVHGTPGPVAATALDAMAAELEDPEFSRIVWEGLRSEPAFRDHHLPPEADYTLARGAELAEAMARSELGGKPYDLAKYLTPPKRQFDPALLESLTHAFVQILVGASMELNLCCGIAHESDLQPLTDFKTHNKLLARRYARGAGMGEGGIAASALSILSLRVLDHVVPPALVENASIQEIVALRKANLVSYAAFRSHLLRLCERLDKEELTSDVERQVVRMLREEVEPLANDFRNEMERLGEEFFGKMYKTAVKSAGGFGAFDVAVNALRGLTWEGILLQGCGIVVASVLPPLRDYFQEKKNVKRRNALAYLMAVRTGLGG